VGGTFRDAGQMPVKKENTMRRIQGGFRDVSAEDLGNTCAVRSQRERWTELSHAFCHLFSTFPIRSNPLAIPCPLFVGSTHRRRRMVEGWRAGGLEEMSGQV